jgi:dTDP-L-rhamnose 4-epimerase
MKILITGGAGFIGSKLSLELKKKGYEVTVLDNLSSQIHGENPDEDSPLYRNILGNVNFIKGDVAHFEDWEKRLKDRMLSFTLRQKPVPDNPCTKSRNIRM